MRTLEKEELKVGTVLVVGYEYRVVVATNFDPVKDSITVIILGTEGYDTGGGNNIPYQMFLPITYAEIVSKEEAQRAFPRRWNEVGRLFPEINK